MRRMAFIFLEDILLSVRSTGSDLSAGSGSGIPVSRLRHSGIRHSGIQVQSWDADYADAAETAGSFLALRSSLAQEKNTAVCSCGGEIALQGAIRRIS